MAVPLIQTIPSILAIVICIVILIMLNLNYLLNRFLPSLLFIIFFVGILLWAVTKLVSVLLPDTMNETFMLFWKVSSLTILILSLLVIAYFRDLLLYSTLAIPSVVVSFFAGITLGAIWIGAIWGSDFITVSFDNISGWNTDYDTWFMVILLVYLVTVYIFMFSLLIKGLFKASIKKQKTQLVFIITGMAIAAIGGTAINFILNIFYPTLGDMDLIFIVVGFALVAIAYLRSPIQIYFAPVIAQRLIVINNHGIPLLTHDFCEPSEKALTMDSTLISGALSGIVNILQEALASDSIPTMLKLEDRVLLLEKSNSALYALIVDDESMVLRSALKDFAKEFEKAFKHILKDWKGLTDLFDDAYKLITEDFSFILTSRRIDKYET
ncbi:MAG TPA: hypothetical protein VMX55_08085 [candidate division Zixibacteria bacterium]|nr:hypothetical protein [candidate division Zixibacteria bacterium]